VADQLPIRRAARVLLLDPEDRVLLMRYDDGPPNGHHWTTPGGGLNDGEDYRAAALRERGVEAMHVADGIAAWRWWTLAELDTTDEAVWPSHLAGLVRSALPR
jgi:hypothetical protein